MRNKNIFILFLLIFTFFAKSNFAQNIVYYPIITDTLKINTSNLYSISSVAIISNSEVISINGKILLKTDYSFNFNEGRFSLNKNVKASFTDTLIVTYQSYVVPLKKEYKNKSLVIVPDILNNDTKKISVIDRQTSLSETIFGKGIQKSGSLIRGFQVGSNKDFTLNSGLRLQLSGKLSDEIEIVAALSDENSPIQAEGNTEKLSEIDKVFIQIKHKNAVGTFGDFDLVNNEGEFSRITRKLQGLKGEFFTGDIQGFVAIASSRGKFNTSQFSGSDGNQGPYILYGTNNENDITIIAGSEKVYLDGMEMKRGENNDYIIDYTSSQLTFTPKRLITSASRIVVDFEYTDQKYQRNFLALNLSSKLFTNSMKVTFNYFRESDDQDNLIDYSLSDAEKKILEQAGSDRQKAVISGVTAATPDSTGKLNGAYSKRDTTISGNSYSYYVYEPGSSNAIYNIVFTYIGPGKGDYSRQTLSVYKFAGVGLGSYMPVKYLAMPELKQNANLIFETNLIKNTNLNLELAFSSYNPNRFSISDKTTFNGLAGNMFFELKPVDLNLFENQLGKISFSVRERFLQNDYNSFERINTVEFNRDYNINSAASGNEELREVNLNYQPFAQLTDKFKYGSLSKGESFKADRYVNSLKYSDPDKAQVEYNIDYVKSDNLFISTDWNKQNGKASYTLGIIRPGIEFLYENKNEKNTLNDSLYSTSYRYAEAAPYIELSKVKGFDLRAQVSFREESFPVNGQLEKQSDVFLRTLKLGLSFIPEFTSNINLTLRNKKYTPIFAGKGFTNNETLLIYSQNKFNFWSGAITGDLYYEASTEQTAKLQKVFVKVTKGTGNYVYIGDVNKNGIIDENDFQLSNYDGDYVVVLLPTDQLYPVIDLKTSSKWNVDFSKFIKDSDSFIKFIKPLSTETYLRIEENSQDNNTSDIYFLKFSKFLNDSTTIRGTNYFQQDVYLFKNASSFSVRGRFNQKRSLSQYAGGAEKGFSAERSIRIQFKMVEEIGIQTDFINQDDNYLAPLANSRSRTSSKNELSSDFSYRPQNNIESGLKVSVGRVVDSFPAKPTEINMNSQLLRFNLSFVGSGRLRIELERDELTSNSNNVIPYEITNGNSIGKNYYWRLNFDYRLSANFSATVAYDGRIQGSNKTINSLRAEARAFF